MLTSSLVRTLRATALALVCAGCSASDLVSTDPPLSTTDPDAVKTAAGAVELYRGVINEFRGSTTGYLLNPRYVVMSGLLSDELTSGQYANSQYSAFNAQSAIDSRNMRENESDPTIGIGYESVWRGLQHIRTSAMVAIPALRKYAPNAPRDYVGHSFALWGMSEIMLSNFFCSGIPLSTIELQGHYTYMPGSSTQQVYEHAVAMFDSALVYAEDSAQYRNLARVGKGWALLNLKRYAEAATAVHDVPDDFVYANLHSAVIAGANGTPNFTVSLINGSQIRDGFGTVADSEGGVGLPYRSSGDPRTASSTDENWRDWNNFPETEVWAPDRWTQGNPGFAPITMASGVEARLIEAEAALAAGSPTWLTILNMLRTTGATDEEGNYVAGTGGFAGLAPLDDPVDPELRVDLLFQERAYWLFLTGRRHSDMRRLVRQYNRPEDQVFPTGQYPIGPVGVYGGDVNAPAPTLEKTLNPRYTGCINRDA